jgi:hypothetical protein
MIFGFFVQSDNFSRKIIYWVLTIFAIVSIYIGCPTAEEFRGLQHPTQWSCHLPGMYLHIMPITALFSSTLMGM